MMILISSPSFRVGLAVGARGEREKVLAEDAGAAFADGGIVVQGDLGHHRMSTRAIPRSRRIDLMVPTAMPAIMTRDCGARPVASFISA